MASFLNSTKARGLLLWDYSLIPLLNHGGRCVGDRAVNRCPSESKKDRLHANKVGSMLVFLVASLSFFRNSNSGVGLFLSSSQAAASSQLFILGSTSIASPREFKTSCASTSTRKLLSALACCALSSMWCYSVHTVRQLRDFSSFPGTISFSNQHLASD